ncbi:MAG: permease-like cell division protein FtsX [Sulfuricellaceae bacterium]
MKVWLIHHQQAFAQVLAQLMRTPFASLLTMLVIGVALSLPAGLYALLKNIDYVATQAHGEPQITLVLASSANAAMVGELQTRLKSNRAIAEFHFISRDQGLQELGQNSGLSDITAGLEKNPLPDVFMVRPAARDPEAVGRLHHELQQLPKVEAALLDEAWVKRLHALLGLGQNAVTILSALLGFALTVITGNTIRLQILSQRDEIEVSKLIGATDPFVRRPFLYHGAVQGFAGGVIAWLIVVAAFFLLNAGIDKLTDLYALNLRLAIPAGVEILELLLFATLLGWLGAYLSVSQHLREIEPR